MVSFWPWKGDDNSPASFEKALSALSNKITKTNSKLDSLRQTSRRFSALWTLYTSFVYLLCTIVLVLVVGWGKWGVAEYVGVIGGPIVFGQSLPKLAITTLYGLRIAKVQSQSDDLQKQRDATIEKLKAATRYNMTQELLKKYGGTPPSSEKSNDDHTPKSGSKQKDSPTSRQGRTGFVPPPTANIPGRHVPVSLPNTPQQAIPRSRDRQGQDGRLSAAAAVAPWQSSPPQISPSAEFAPNAFFSAPQYAQQGEGSRWYDRLMDLVLGEDETLPRNRLALICHHCRLVNGQVPPGVQRLEDVGKWRCAGCSTMNGKEMEETELLNQIKERTTTPKIEFEEAEEKSAALDTSSSEDCEEEDVYNGGEGGILLDGESSGSGDGKRHTRGTVTGTQKGANSTRRRSKRVLNTEKG
ncbi:MAG: hypothetical protein Q9184_002800 [Pyrenodesmia sp. 2 TL-2023]